MWSASARPAPTFLSTPSARRATQVRQPHHAALEHFYPRPLRGGRPAPPASTSCSASISIHALCEEGDTSANRCWTASRKFLSTPSARRATLAPYLVLVHRNISIHALCEEGDTTAADCYPQDHNFYPRPLRGGRPLHHHLTSNRELFLSTPSARRATFQPGTERPVESHFYPRPLRGGRPTDSCRRLHCRGHFYPRPLRGGRPTVQTPTSTFWSTFLSTPSARRATLRQCPHCK